MKSHIEGPCVGVPAELPADSRHQRSLGGSLLGRPAQVSVQMTAVPTGLTATAWEAIMDNAPKVLMVGPSTVALPALCQVLVAESSLIPHLPLGAQGRLVG